ncbi:hypothetical protein SAMN03159343_3604 [Klenkia marina]|uniref:Uncharacterized protein n=1 Tax=Klenkia marina TaxID=1960309 RepID=A0A1G4YUP0_9ACTN|nr:hypothetical protein [Klenkia marina]SCX57192.1 hypothetical protein SAMN03159343_3604 [Klenkia marina]
MSMRTTIGGLVLGGALAAAALAPTSGTMALLSDQATVESSAGAGSLGVEAVAVAPGLVLAMGDRGTVQVTTAGDLAWSLRIESVDSSGTPDCGVAGQLRITSDLGTPSTPAAGECPVLVREGSGATTGALTIQRDGAPQPRVWTGALRVTLQQLPGGFSDVVDLPLELVAPGGSGSASGPPASGGPGAPSNGTGPGNGAGNGPRPGTGPGNGGGAGNGGGSGGGSPTAGRPGAAGPPSASAGLDGSTAGAAPQAGTQSQAPESTGTVPPPSAPVDEGAPEADAGAGVPAEQTADGGVAPGEPAAEG